MAGPSQISDTILMVRPACFGFNEQTAESNAFQTNDRSLSPAQIQEQAVKEFDAFVAALRQVGVEVIVVEDTPSPVKTDAVFPNNWVTFHQDGTVFTYPMFAPVRRLERRADILELLSKKYQINQHIHLEDAEARHLFLEGTGSMILDRVNRLAYACLSPRTDKGLFEDFCEKADYTPVIFHSVDANGKDIYHTNVMMALGETFAVICLDTIKDLTERVIVENYLLNSGKEIIAITLDQMNAFAGNMLQVKSRNGQSWLVMSQQAYDVLTDQQIESIKRHTFILSSPIPVIETYGGGSARCMMAEVFLPQK